MLGDLAHPLQFADDNRDEILLISFDGFIKNTSEGLVRTMLRNEEDWIEKYPNLQTFELYDPDELYENTMIFHPSELLYLLSDGKVTEEDIDHDLDTLLPTIFLQNSKITTFEFSLFQLLQQPFVKKVIFYRESTFYENEIMYIMEKYDEVIDKVSLSTGGIFATIDEYHPTTIFTNEFYLIDALFKKDIDPEDKLMVVLLNSNQNMKLDGDNKFVYREDFNALIKEISKKESFGITTMFNFLLESEEMTNSIKEENDE